MLTNIARGSTHQTFSIEVTSVAIRVVTKESFRALAIFCTNKMQKSSAVMVRNLGNSDFFMGKTTSRNLDQALRTTRKGQRFEPFVEVRVGIIFSVQNIRADSSGAHWFSQVY